MTSLAPETPVGLLAANHPSKTHVLDRLGIDYCCGGRMPLSQACAAKGIDVEAVLREFASDDPWDAEEEAVYTDGTTDTSLSDLADRIVATHHAYLRHELPRLGELLTKVINAHAGRHPELLEVRRVFARLASELNCHMLKEEMVLFPLIKQLETATAQVCGIDDPIHVMEHEHAACGADLERMRHLTGGYTPPADGCNSYRVLLHGLAELELDLHQHIHKENNILFPRASELQAALRG